MEHGWSLIGPWVEFEGGRANSTLGLTPLSGRQPKLVLVTTPVRTRRVGAILFGVLAALAATLLGTGFTYETIASTLDRRALPAPGALIDVGGHQLHLV